MGRIDVFRPFEQLHDSVSEIDLKRIAQGLVVVGVMAVSQLAATIEEHSTWDGPVVQSWSNAYTRDGKGPSQLRQSHETRVRIFDIALGHYKSDDMNLYRVSYGGETVRGIVYITYQDLHFYSHSVPAHSIVITGKMGENRGELVLPRDLLRAVAR